MIIFFLGGLVIFLYGQFLLERNLQKTSRAHLKAVIKLLAKHRAFAILVGSVLTIGMQSSTVSVITLIDLINLGILKLSTAIGIVLGAGIGTTIVLQTISFNIDKYALWVIVAGFVISKVSRFNRGGSLIGLGFMFYGIYLMGRGAFLLKDTQIGSVIQTNMMVNPFYGMAGAFILTVLSQSTLAPMAVGITLVREGGLGAANVVPIILGAHVGSGILPLVYSWKVSGSAIGRQLGVANLLYRIAGALIFLPLMGLLAGVSLLVTRMAGAGDVRQAANAHTIFTLITAGLFIPFIVPYTIFIKKIMPEKKETAGKDMELEMSEENILNHLRQEELKLAEETHKILSGAIRLWEEDKLRDVDKIERQCLAIHSYSDKALLYLTEEARGFLKEDKFKTVLRGMSNLEKISDVAGDALTSLARKKIMHGINFSIEGLDEVLGIHKHLIEEFNVLLKGLKDKKISPESKMLDEKINMLISASFSAHINRMCKGFHETKDTRQMHNNAITILEHIHWHIRGLLANS